METAIIRIIEKKRRLPMVNPGEYQGNHPGCPPPGGTEISHVLDRVSRFVLGLELETLRMIKIKDIAVVFDINASFLSRKFKDHNRCTLCEFIQREKIRRAETLLQEERKLSIADLSQRMGFATTEYFIRFFKQKVGVSPHKFRLYRQTVM